MGVSGRRGGLGDTALACAEESTNLRLLEATIPFWVASGVRASTCRPRVANRRARLEWTRVSEEGGAGRLHGVECSRDGRTHGANKAEEIVRRGVTGSTTGLCA
jgi:hypothetical protein